MSLYSVTGYQYYLYLTRKARNRVNQMICKAKGDYIRNQLHENSRNPKTFWRVIDKIINPGKNISYEPRFYDKAAEEYVVKGSESDF